MSSRPSWTSRASSATARNSVIWRTTKRPIADGAVAGHHRPCCQLDEPLDRGRPVEREAVAEERRRIVLQEVAGEEDVGVGDTRRRCRCRCGRGRDSVSSTERPPGSISTVGGVGERPFGWIEDDLGELVGKIRQGDRGRLPLPLAGRLDHRHAALVAPDLGRAEGMVAEAVVGVAMGVDDDPDGEGGEFPQVGDWISAAWRWLSRVSTRRTPVVAEDDADVLVVERVAPDEDAVAELGPARTWRAA